MERPDQVGYVWKTRLHPNEYPFHKPATVRMEYIPAPELLGAQNRLSLARGEALPAFFAGLRRPPGPPAQGHELTIKLFDAAERKSRRVSGLYQLSAARRV